MSKILVKNADWVMTMDPKRRLIRNGAIVIQDDRLIAVGKTDNISSSFEADTVIDATGKLVMPGLIDCHVHNTQFLVRGHRGDAELPLKQALFERIFPYETSLTYDYARWSSYACQMELIQRGVTTFIESGSYYPDAVGEVTKETGLRGIMARSATDIHATGMGKFPDHYPGHETMEETLRNGKATAEKWSGAANGRIKAWFALRFLQACSDELIKETKKLADEYNAGFQIHVGHSREGVEATLAKYGMRDIERLDALGVLSPNLLCVHMGWVTMAEVIRLKENDVKVAYCPDSNLRSAYGTFTVGKFPEMIDMGITICLGTDAQHANMLKEIYLGVNVYKDTRLDPAIIKSEKVLEMATINGAKVAMWDKEIGSLEVGKKADVSIFDISGPGCVPSNNPVYTLVYSCDGSEADTVIVDGKILMEGKKIQTFDVKAVSKKVQEASDSLAEKSGLAKYLKPLWVVE